MTKKIIVANIVADLAITTIIQTLIRKTKLLDSTYRKLAEFIVDEMQTRQEKPINGLDAS